MEHNYYSEICENCLVDWDKILCNEVAIDKTLQLFFLNHINPDCVLNDYSKCALSAETIGEFFVDAILNIKATKLLNLIGTSGMKRELISSANIPQFSNFEEIDNVIRILADSGIEHLNYKTIGYFLAGKEKSNSAKQKYGENHYKLAKQLGFASSLTNYKVSVLGVAYRKLSDDRSRGELKSKLILRVPIIQEALIQAENRTVNLTEIMEEYLSRSTAERRGSSIKKLLHILTELNSSEINTRIGCITWGG